MKPSTFCWTLSSKMVPVSDHRLLYMTIGRQLSSHIKTYTTRWCHNFLLLVRFLMMILSWPVVSRFGLTCVSF